MLYSTEIVPGAMECEIVESRKLHGRRSRERCGFTCALGAGHSMLALYIATIRALLRSQRLLFEVLYVRVADRIGFDTELALFTVHESPSYHIWAYMMTRRTLYILFSTPSSSILRPSSSHSMSLLHRTGCPRSVQGSHDGSVSVCDVLRICTRRTVF